MQLGEHEGAVFGHVAVGVAAEVVAAPVPAAVGCSATRVWWPSTARGGGHALREHAEEPQVAAATEAAS